MVEQVDIWYSVHMAVGYQLRIARKNAKPWPDAVLGQDGVSGYGFETGTIKSFVERCYINIANDTEMINIKDIILKDLNNYDNSKYQEILELNVSGLKEMIAGRIWDRVGGP